MGNGEPFEIVFVSSDKSAEELMSYMKVQQLNLCPLSYFLRLSKIWRIRGPARTIWSKLTIEWIDVIPWALPQLKEAVSRDLLLQFFSRFLPIWARYSYAEVFSHMVLISRRYSQMPKTLRSQWRCGVKYVFSSLKIFKWKFDSVFSRFSPNLTQDWRFISYNNFVQRFKVMKIWYFSVTKIEF